MDNYHAAPRDVSHSSYLPQSLQFLQLFVVVVRILSVILQDELEEEKETEQVDKHGTFSRVRFQNHPNWNDMFLKLWFKSHLA